MNAPEQRARHEGDFAEWRLDVKAPVQNAVLSIRYARARQGDAEYKVTVPTLGFVERYGFKCTGGWGNAPGDFAVAVLRLGDVPAGIHTASPCLTSRFSSSTCMIPLPLRTK